METKDLAIIGGGIAGASCAIYAKRAGLNCALFERGLIGGQLLYTEYIDNYIGLPPRYKGGGLTQNLNEALGQLKVEIIPQEVTRIELHDYIVELGSQSESWKMPALVIATGASFKKLGLKGEEEFIGKGISYCAICDGFFFRDKVVAVVGGGNTALEEALYLSNLCQKVFLIHRRGRLRAIDYLQQEVAKKQNIELVLESVVKEIKGDQILNAVILENTKNQKETFLNLSGLFIAIGLKPNTDIFRDVITLDENGFILTDEEMKTSAQCIWACGDCRKRPLRQLITAAAEGAIAAISVYRYLKGSYISV